MSLPHLDIVKNTPLIDFISYYHETLGNASPITYNPDPSTPIYGDQDAQVDFEQVMGLSTPSHLRQGSTIGKYLHLYMNGLPYNLPPEPNLQEIKPFDLSSSVVDNGIARIADMIKHNDSYTTRLTSFAVNFINWYETLSMQHQALSLYTLDGSQAIKTPQGRIQSLMSRYRKYLDEYLVWYRFAVDVWAYEAAIIDDSKSDKDRHAILRRLHSFTRTHPRK